MTRTRNVADIIKQPFTTTLGTSNYRAGVNAGNSIASGGNYNVVVGDEAGTAITTGDFNAAFGYIALDGNTTGGRNSAFGAGALGTMNVTDGSDTYNTAVGFNAGTAISTGVQNTLIGALAGDALTDADSNVAVGYQSLSANTKGGRAVAIGQFALAAQNLTTAGNVSYNTAVGYSAGSGITSGVGNTIMGAIAGDALTDADYNVAVGRSALGTDTLGSTATALGFGTLATQNFTSATNSFNAAVGYQAGTSVTTGVQNTLIGASAGDSITDGLNNTLLGYNVDCSSGTQHAIIIGHGITGAGSDFSFGKASNVVSNDFDADAAFSRSSDLRLKTNVANATLGLNFINDLRPVTYKWKASADLDANDAELAHLRVADADDNIINHMTTDVTMHGLIAQEVKTALDTASVSTFKGWHEDQYGVQQISREMFVIPLIKAIQELSATNNALTARITALEGA